MAGVQEMQEQFPADLSFSEEVLNERSKTVLECDQNSRNKNRLEPVFLCTIQPFIPADNGSFPGSGDSSQSARNNPYLG
jgi:hypothetical protein